MAFDTVPLDDEFKALAAFDWGDDAGPLAKLDAAVVDCHGDAALTADLERRFGEIVAGKASRAAKEYACRKLSMIGTAASVPALAPLLADPDNSHMARFALERIPDPAAADALRRALGTARGDLAIGMISSLANRGDAASVPHLVSLLGGDGAVAAAAASALGRIATPEAATALAAAKVSAGPVAEAVIDARLACADAFLAAGERRAAQAIYEAVAAGVGDAPSTRRGRAVRMAARSGILAALDDTVTRLGRGGFMAGWIALTLLLPAAWADVAPVVSVTARQAAEGVLGAIDAADADVRAVALERVRYGLRGRWFTDAVVARLPTMDPSRQDDLLMALADRGDRAAVAAATKLLSTATDPSVRAAAIGLLGRLGGSAELAMLLNALAAGGPEREAACRGLVTIGPDAAATLRAAASTGPAATREAVIDALAERRDRAALPALVKATGDADANVRIAALRALAAFGGANEIPTLVAVVLRSTDEERKAAEAAVVKVCASAGDSAPATAALLQAYEAADDDARRSLLPTLARVGGPRVMAIVDAMLADPATRQRGLDALSKWPDATVKDRLLELLGRATDPDERELLLGTLIRIAPLPDNKLNDAQKLDLLVKTMALCEQVDDRAKILERANAIRTIDTFRFVVSYLDDPSLAESACRSAVELAHHQKLRDAHKAEFTKALDKVLAITQNAELRERATRYKAGQTWDRAKKN